MAIEVKHLQIGDALLVVDRFFAGCFAVYSDGQSGGRNQSAAKAVDIPPGQFIGRVNRALLFGFEQFELDAIVGVGVGDKLYVAKIAPVTGLIGDGQSEPWIDATAFIDQVAFGQNRKIAGGEFVERAFFRPLVKLLGDGQIGRAILPEGIGNSGDGRVFNVIENIEIVEENPHALNIDAIGIRCCQVVAKILPIDLVEKEILVLKITIVLDRVGNGLRFALERLSIARCLVLGGDKGKIDRADLASGLDTEKPSAALRTEADQARTRKGQGGVASFDNLNDAVFFTAVL